MLSVLLAALGCSAETEPGSGDSTELEVFTWWREGPENDAFRVVTNAHLETYGVFVENKADPTATDARGLMAQHLLAGDPPSTFQANLGADLLRWAVVETDGRLQPQRRIHGLGSLFQELGLNEDVFPNSLLDALRVGPDSEPFAMPLNIHRLNVVYYDADKWPDQSFPDLTTLCPADPAPGDRLDATIAVGTVDGFTLTLLAFEAVLPALHGAAFYDALMRGAPPEDWETKVTEALECVQYLSRSFASGALTWSDAAELVGTGRADFTVMGDWTSATLAAELAEGSVKAVPFPDADDEGVFVFTSDTFPLPIGAPQSSETTELLATMASPEVQAAFSAAKGSIPARLDAEPAPGSEITREQFEQADKVLATSGLFPPYYPDEALQDALRAMTAQGAGQDEIDAVIRVLRNGLPLLRHWQERLQKGPASAVSP